MVNISNSLALKAFPLVSKSWERSKGTYHVLCVLTITESFSPRCHTSTFSVYQRMNHFSGHGIDQELFLFSHTHFILPLDQDVDAYVGLILIQSNTRGT